MEKTIEKIIEEINKAMPITASNKVKKGVDDCYREILTKYLIVE